MSEQIRSRFSRDASILTLKPSLVIYPRTTNDVRKVARFTWQLAEKGHVLPITARGSGTDMNGAAIGRGIVMVFPAHLNRILELDTKQKLVRVQPGVNFKSLQETLHTHGLYLPAFPASYEYSTIGGAIANNASGIKSAKYGPMRAWVDRLEVVLANGEVIQTGQLSKKQFAKKLGLPTLEGELYRAVNAVLNDDHEAFNTYIGSLGVEQDTIGYSFDNLRQKKSGIDLTSLFVGSQGTLGIITEAILRVAKYSPLTSIAVAAFANLDDAVEAASRLTDLEPSALELIDGDLLQFVAKHHGVTLPEELMIASGIPAAVLLIEADDTSARKRKKFFKQATKTVADFTDAILISHDFDQRERLWAVRYVSSLYMGQTVTGKTAVPIIQDITVPHHELRTFIHDAKALCKKYHVEAALWMHVLGATVQLMPMVDLSKLGDRQRVFKMMDEYYRMVIKLGGSIAAGQGEGRLRVPFVKLQAGEEVMGAYLRLKAAVDPHGTMNPGVKTGTSIKDLVDMLSHDYSLDAFADYLPKL